MYARNDKPPIITNQYGMLYAILSLIISFNKHIIWIWYALVMPIKRMFNKQLKA